MVGSQGRHYIFSNLLAFSPRIFALSLSLSAARFIQSLAALFRSERPIHGKQDLIDTYFRAAGGAGGVGKISAHREMEIASEHVADGHAVAHRPRKQIVDAPQA